jgi:hypothetical protein
MHLTEVLELIQRVKENLDGGYPSPISFHSKVYSPKETLDIFNYSGTENT